MSAYLSLVSWGDGDGPQNWYKRNVDAKIQTNYKLPLGGIENMRTHVH